MLNKLIVILGPTATGKSNLGLELARLIDGEIISGDSVLVYKGLNIGSAKPSNEELNSVPHHLVNVLNPNDKFDVTTFKSMVEELVTEINARGKTPILVGGTGLYIKSVLEDYSFLPVEENTALRLELENFADTNGNQALHDRLRTIDPAAAERLYPNDRFRVIRAIEIALSGVTTKADSERKIRSDYQAAVYGLNMDRAKLYERINYRVLKMFEQGLVEEVQTLLDSGVSSQAQAMKSIGYKQVIEYLDGLTDYDNCVASIQQATRNFAKRQITWFKSMPYINWLEIDEQTDLAALAKKISLEAIENEN